MSEHGVERDAPSVAVHPVDTLGDHSVVNPLAAYQPEVDRPAVTPSHSVANPVVASQPQVGRSAAVPSHPVASSRHSVAPLPSRPVASSSHSVAPLPSRPVASSRHSVAPLPSCSVASSSHSVAPLPCASVPDLKGSAARTCVGGPPLTATNRLRQAEHADYSTCVVALVRSQLAACCARAAQRPPGRGASGGQRVMVVRREGLEREGEEWCGGWCVRRDGRCVLCVWT